MNLLHVVIRPLIWCAAEKWRRPTDARREIRGPVQDGDVWLIRTHEELLNMFNRPSITKEVVNKNPSWLEHLQRMSESSGVKKVIKQIVAF